MTLPDEPEDISYAAVQEWPPAPDDGTLLEVRADPTPLLIALGAGLISLAALIVSIIAIVD